MGLTRKIDRFRRGLSSRFSTKSGNTSAAASAATSAAPTPAPASRVPTPCPEPDKSYPELLAPESPPPSPVPPALSVDSLPAAVPQRLWRRAYDELKDRDAKGSEPEIVEAYDAILSKLCRDRADNAEAAAQSSPPTRQEMWELVKDGLERTKKGAKAKGKVDEVLGIVDTIKKPIDTAMKFVPEAAPLWAGVTIGIEILANPMKQPGLNRKGIEYVLSRMAWYWSLSGLVLDRAKSERPSGALLGDLEDRLADLYKKLLLYQMRSTCLYHRNWASVILRDTVQLDDWAGAVTEIKDAEAVLRADYEQYSSMEAASQRDQIEQNTRPLKPGLDKIDSSIRAQTEEHRQEHRSEKDNECLRDLLVTDPEEDRKRILNKKGTLLRDSYGWILEHETFVDFRENPASQLLWIRGDPGKGKTMLMCGIIDELEASKIPLSYFFCEATEVAQSTVTVVLRGLIYMLARQKLPLMSHIREVYDIKGVKAFDGINAAVSLQTILTNMIKDPLSHGTVLLVDALDECSVETEEHIAQLIVSLSNLGYARWIVSSRNWPEIEQHILGAQNANTVHLELNRGSVSTAVDMYIDRRVEELGKKYEPELKNEVRQYLLKNADNTFLWVALVCKGLANVQPRRALEELRTFPPGLDALYNRMMGQILASDEADRLKQILATACVAFRPLQISELIHLVESTNDYDGSSMEDAVLSCGSFLTIQDGSVYWVHQSAKDFILKRENNGVLPTHSDWKEQHLHLSVMCIKSMKAQLKRNMYSLDPAGWTPRAHLTVAPSPSPLDGMRYSCSNWIQHLLSVDLKRGQVPVYRLQHVSDFFECILLYWLEAMCLLVRNFCFSGTSDMDELILALVSALIRKTQPIHQTVIDNSKQGCDYPQLLDSAVDARRFLYANQMDMEFNVLWVYSALLFSPACSLVRQRFHQEETDWIDRMPCFGDHWTNHEWEFPFTDEIITPTCNGKHVVALTKRRSSCGIPMVLRWNWPIFEYDIRKHIPDCTKMTSVAISRRQGFLVKVLEPSVVHMWRYPDSPHLRTFNLPGASGRSVVFCSTEGTLMAVSIGEGGIRIWRLGVAVDIYSNSKDMDSPVLLTECSFGAEQLEVGSSSPIAMSQDGLKLAIGSSDGTVRIWDTTLNACVGTLPHQFATVTSIIFAANDSLVITGTETGGVVLWNDITAGTSRSIDSFDGHDNDVIFLTTCPDTFMLVSASADNIKAWYAPTLFQESPADRAMGKSPVTRFFPANRQTREAVRKVKIRDKRVSPSLDAHAHEVVRLGFSPDGSMLVSISTENQVKVWTCDDYQCLLTCDDAAETPRSDISMSWFSFTTSNSRIALTLKDYSIGVWDLTTLKRTHTIESQAPHLLSKSSPHAWAFALSPDGQHLGLASDDIGMWNFSKDTRVRRFSIPYLNFGVPGALKSKASLVSIFSRDLKLVAVSLSMSGARVEIWSCISGTCIQTLNPAMDARRCPDMDDRQYPVIFSLGNKWLVVGIGTSYQAMRIFHEDTNAQAALAPRTVHDHSVRETSMTVSTSYGDLTWENKKTTSVRARYSGYGIPVGSHPNRIMKREWVVLKMSFLMQVAMNAPRSTIAMGGRDGRITFMKLPDENEI